MLFAAPKHYQPVWNDEEKAHQQKRPLQSKLGQNRRIIIKWLAVIAALVCVASLSGVANDTYRSLDASSAQDCILLPDPNDRFTCHYKTTQFLYKQRQSSQSRTLLEASAEYERRYRRPAPSWFPAWYNWAKAHNIETIDDYDQIDLDMRYLRNTDVRQALKTMQIVSDKLGAKEGKAMMSLLEMRGGVANIVSPWADAIAGGFKMIVDPIAHLVPDLEILVSWGDLALVRAAEPNPTSINATQPGHLWEKAESTSEYLHRPCPVDPTVIDLRKYDVLRSKQRFDVCNERDFALLKERQGRFQFEVDAGYNVSFPILSSAKMSTEQDILFPMRGYQYGVIQTQDEIAWEDKADSLYWRGSTSGQFNTMANWNTSHRSRFVFNAQYWQRTADSLRSASASERALSSAKLLSSQEAKDRDMTAEGLHALQSLPSSVFNVSFTKLHFCESDMKACEKIAAKAPIGPLLPSDTAWQHRFLFDLDGYGMSERYYSLLSSNSVVLKQTAWTEWHDELLIPWVHFVPVSLTMEELPALMTFLITDPRGKRIARQIAQQSKDFVHQQIGLTGQAAYMLRLLLEYSDIVSSFR